MKITTFEDAKAGDQLWSVEFGWGEVVSRDNVSKSFTVEFNGDEFETYCFKGSRKRPLREKMQTLFWDEIVIEAPEKPLPDLAVDTKVIVWDCITPKTKRYFSHFSSSGKMMCFVNGMASWTTTVTSEWDHFEVVE